MALVPLPEELLPEEPLPEEPLDEEPFEDLPDPFGVEEEDLLSDEDLPSDEEDEVEVAGADSDLLSEVAGFSALTFPARESLR